MEAAQETVRTVGATIIPWVPAAACILGGWIGGVLAERVVMGRLRRWAQISSWAHARIVVDAVKGMTRLWITVFGLYLASTVVPGHLLTDAHHEIFAKAMKLVMIYSATVVAARIICTVVNLYAERYERFGSSSIITNVVRVAVYVMGALIALQTMDFQIAPILTALGVGGLAVALALQDTLSQLFAGIHIVVSREVRSGDYVKLESGEEGRVEDITWRNTSVRTGLDNLVLVPNAKLAGAVITNYSLPQPKVKFSVPLGVAYDSDLDHVEQVVIEVGREVLSSTKGGNQAHEPVVRYKAFADSSINLIAVLGAETWDDIARVQHAFIKSLHKRFAAEGIEMPFPTRTLIHRAAPGETAQSLAPSTLPGPAPA